MGSRIQGNINMRASKGVISNLPMSRNSVFFNGMPSSPSLPVKTKESQRILISDHPSSNANNKGAFSSSELVYLKRQADRTYSDYIRTPP